jgi:hypothetical protein
MRFYAYYFIYYAKYYTFAKRWNIKKQLVEFLLKTLIIGEYKLVKTFSLPWEYSS